MATIDIDPRLLGQADQMQSGQLELASNDLMAALAARTAQAQQQANAAGAQYQQAQAAPTPNVYQQNPVATSVATGLGRIAEGLGRPEAPGQIRASIGDRQKELAARRLENLNSLGKNYELLSKRADALGDIETSTKYKVLSDKLAREQDKIIQRMRGEQAMGEITARGEQDRQTNAAKPVTGSASVDPFALEAYKQKNRLELANLRQKGDSDATVEIGRRDVLARGAEALKDYKIAEREGIIKAIQDEGKYVMPKKALDTMGTLTAARTALATLKRLSGKIHTASGASAYGAGASATMGQLAKKRPDITTYKGIANGLLATLARSTGEKGTLAASDVDRARGMVPSASPLKFASKEEAESQLAELENFLNEQEALTIQNYAISGASRAGGTPGAAPTPAAAPSGGNVRMRAPDGRTLSVPADRVAEMEAKGAVRVQ